MNNQLWGIYSNHINELVDIKRQIGFKYDTEEHIYKHFDRFTISRGEKEIGITRELAEEWIKKKPNESDSYRYKKAVCLNQLASFLSKQGIPSYISQLPPFRYSFVPYIYNKQEITNIFEACDKLTIKSGRKSIIIIIPALIRLLYGTDLRISEALSLQNEDVNLDQQFLIVRDSKNGGERMLPTADSLVEVCREYLKYREMLPIGIPDSNNFFLSLDGRECQSDYVRKWFKVILKQAGIAISDAGPRVHDLRHTFCVHSLASME